MSEAAPTRRPGGRQVIPRPPHTVEEFDPPWELGTNWNVDELVAPVRQRKLAASIEGATVYEVDGDHAACIADADLFVPTLITACHDVAVRAGLELRVGAGA